MTPLPAAACVAGKLAVAYRDRAAVAAVLRRTASVVNHVELAPATWLTVLVVAGARRRCRSPALGLLIGYLFDAEQRPGRDDDRFFSLAILGGLWAPVSSFPDTLATIARMHADLPLREPRLGCASPRFAPDLGTS